MTHDNCNICNKKTFFSKAEFLEAHGGKINIVPPSPWIYKKSKDKSSPTIFHKWICKSCKGITHKKTCEYFW